MSNSSANPQHGHTDKCRVAVTDNFQIRVYQVYCTLEPALVERSKLLTSLLSGCRADETITALPISFDQLHRWRAAVHAQIQDIQCLPTEDYIAALLVRR